MRLSVVSVYEKKSSMRFFKYILIGLIAFVMIFVWTNIKIRPFIISIAKGYAENAVSNTLNEIIDEAMKKDNYVFVNLLKDSEGKITAVTMNSADTNLLITKITIGLKNRVDDMEEIKADIPLGNFIPYPFFAGLGPKIPVKFLILATTSVTTEETFASQGINQTLYMLSFKVETKVGIYIPTMHSSVSVENHVPISQTLIVGSVPDAYTNVEGLEGSAQDAVMNID